MGTIGLKSQIDRNTAANAFERRVRADLYERRWMRLHAMILGAVTLGMCWGISWLLLRAGLENIALRHAGAMVGAYYGYLGLVYVWCTRLLATRTEIPADVALDAADLAIDAASYVRLPSAGLGDVASSAGDAAGGAFDLLAGADEGVVVAVPLIVVLGVASLLAAALGFAVFGLFGVDVLMGVAVEIAFASAGGALAFKAEREGWLSHVVRRTAGPMAIVLACTVAAGLAIGHWFPQAKTLPEVVRSVTHQQR